ncbi:VOC family protein [Lysobacter korlensis]|uniref:VOC family protein n=1 Tax=Lysobacter korlensis TaxID=553636 RepID=A0ABV6S3L5_9GAMM
MNLNQVTLPATDVVASVAFYRQLGFVQIVDAPHYARFECPTGDATFSVHAAAPGDVGPGVVVYFEFESPDALNAKVEGLRTRGIEFERLPADERWLWREARLRDPAGNRLCFYFAGANRRHPPWRIDTDAPALSASTTGF